MVLITGKVVIHRLLVDLIIITSIKILSLSLKLN